MRDVYIVATGCTSFGTHLESSISDLAREVLGAAAAEVGRDDLQEVDSTWFGSAFMDVWGQANIRGQAALAPLAESGLLRPRHPVTNVEGACATGSVAFFGAVKDIRAGVAEVALAVGIEKMRFDKTVTGDHTIYSSLAGCAEALDDGRLQATYSMASAGSEHPFSPASESSLFMETYAVQARLHMERYGITPRQVALASSLAHSYAAKNPLAQYRFEMSVQEVLNDRPVTYPFTRAMCSPITDGAAAVVVASSEWLKAQPESVRSRAVRVAGMSMTSGRYDRDPASPTLSYDAAQGAYAEAGLRPQDIDVVEVHDATSYGQILQLEMLGFCESGKGGEYIESGATSPGGSMPMNTSGGLVGKGHPIAATGLSMIHELTTQLRGEAGTRQVPYARRGLAENGGGVLGLEEATCVVTILEARA